MQRIITLKEGFVFECAAHIYKSREPIRAIIIGSFILNDREVYLDNDSNNLLQIYFPSNLSHACHIISDRPQVAKPHIIRNYVANTSECRFIRGTIIFHPTIVSHVVNVQTDDAPLQNNLEFEYDIDQALILISKLNLASHSQLTVTPQVPTNGVFMNILHLFLKAITDLKDKFSY